MPRIGIGVALLVAVLTAASATGASAKTRITFITPTVSPGGTLTIKAAGPPGTHCVASILRGTHSVVALPAHTLKEATTTWAYRLPATTKLGPYRVSVSCEKGGAAFASFRVGAPPIAPAQISVIKSGFLAEKFDFDASTFLHCGLQLQNTSVTDARNLSVTVIFADTQGRSLKSKEIDLTVIPAGQTFYASCLTVSSVTIAVASVQVQVKVGKSTAHSAQLPVVSGLNLTPDQFGGTQTLRGNLTSPYSKPMPEDARIYAAFFDANGNIVGGDSTSTGASVQPGATVGFSFSFVPGNVASAQVSVDPCGLAAIFHECQVP